MIQLTKLSMSKDTTLYIVVYVMVLSFIAVIVANTCFPTSTMLAFISILTSLLIISGILVFGFRQQLYLKNLKNNETSGLSESNAQDAQSLSNSPSNSDFLPSRPVESQTRLLRSDIERLYKQGIISRDYSPKVDSHK